MTYSQIATETYASLAELEAMAIPTPSKREPFSKREEGRQRRNERRDAITLKYYWLEN